MQTNPEWQKEDQWQPGDAGKSRVTWRRIGGRTTNSHEEMMGENEYDYDLDF